VKIRKELEKLKKENTATSNGGRRKFLKSRDSRRRGSTGDLRFGTLKGENLQVQFYDSNFNPRAVPNLEDIQRSIEQEKKKHQSIAHDSLPNVPSLSKMTQGSPRSGSSAELSASATTPSSSEMEHRKLLEETERVDREEQKRMERLHREAIAKAEELTRKMKQLQHQANGNLHDKKTDPLRVTVPGSTGDNTISSPLTPMSRGSLSISSPSPRSNIAGSPNYMLNSPQVLSVTEEGDHKDGVSEPAGSRTRLERKIRVQNREASDVLLHLVLELDSELSSSISSITDALRSTDSETQDHRPTMSINLDRAAQLNLEDVNSYNVSLPLDFPKEGDQDALMDQLQHVISKAAAIESAKENHSSIKSILIWDAVTRRPLLKADIGKKNDDCNSSKSWWSKISTRAVFAVGFSILSISALMWLWRSRRLSSKLPNATIQTLGTSKIAGSKQLPQLRNVVGDSLLFRM